MNLTVKCNGCSKSFSVGQQYAGKKIRCPGCRSVIQVPELLEPDEIAIEPSDADQAPVDSWGLAQDSDPWSTGAEVAPGPLPKRVRNRPAPEPVRAAKDALPGPDPYYYTPPSVDRNRSSQSDDHIRIFGYIAAASLALSLLGGLVERYVAGLGGLLAIIGLIISWGLQLYGGVGALIAAFREDVLCGLLYLFLPFYSLYYLISRWEEQKYYFRITILGWLVMVIDLLMVGALNSSS